MRRVRSPDVQRTPSPYSRCDAPARESVHLIAHLRLEFKMTTAGEITNERGSSRGDPLSNRPRPKILVDGGDPEETLRVKQALGFVDGKTTNPSLIAKN